MPGRPSRRIIAVAVVITVAFAATGVAIFFRYQDPMAIILLGFMGLLASGATLGVGAIVAGART